MTRTNITAPRVAFTLIELLVVIAIVGVVMGLLLSAVQRVREAAARTYCQNHVKQIGLALHQFHDTNHAFPPGHRSTRNNDRLSFSGWTLSVLPYLEQNALYQRSLADYRANPFPFNAPIHPGFSSPVLAFVCPSDSRAPGPQVASRTKQLVALLSYLGVSGRDHASADGVLYQDSKVRIGDIADGTTNTLLIGERPPSSDYQFGWWYAGVGQINSGSADLILGVREQNLLPITPGSSCGPGAYPFSPSRFDDPCGMFHFWSPHPGGANFAFADGSVRFLTYSLNPLMPALASLAGGELASIN